MDSIRNNHREREPLSRIRLQEGIILLLSRWYALQMAIKNQWGGCDSIQKSHQLASHLFSWLSKSNGDCVVHYFFFLFHFLFIDSPSIINYVLFVTYIICIDYYSTNMCWRFRKSTPWIHAAYIQYRDRRWQHWTGICTHTNILYLSHFPFLIL
jgi:hypothetical protein